MSTRVLGYTAWNAVSPPVILGQSISVGGQQTVDPVPSTEIDYPAFQEQIIDLPSGIDYTLVLPYSRVTQLIIIPPASATVGITIKGASTDTGLVQLPGGITTLTFPTVSPPASIILHAATGGLLAVRCIWA